MEEKKSSFSEGIILPSFSLFHSITFSALSAYSAVNPSIVSLSYFPVSAAARSLTSWLPSSRSLYFWILPEPVIG